MKKCLEFEFPVWLLKIKLFRPFPLDDVRAALAGVPKVMVPPPAPAGSLQNEGNWERLERKF